MSTSSVAKVILLGNLGADPELRFTKTGNPVVNFSIATTEHWYDSEDEKQEKTSWHKIVVFGDFAEVCNEYLKKGSTVFIEGKLNYKKWESDGITKYGVDIIAQTVKFLDKKPKDTEGEANGNV